MTYARNGYQYCSVITPSIAVEYEMPIDDDAMTAADWERQAILDETARVHGTYIHASRYALL